MAWRKVGIADGVRRPGQFALGGIAALCIALTTGGCAIDGPPSPSAVVGSAAPPAALPVPTRALADTLRIGFVPGAIERGYNAYAGFRQASGGIEWGLITPQSVVHASLYRSDARFDAVPDLADGPCEPNGDGTVIRCHLVEATFHDGTEVTSDDVAYVYGLYLRPTFFDRPLTGRLREVRVVDGRTVDFVLQARDPTFVTESLRNVPIIPRRAIEASHAAFETAGRGMVPGDLEALADTIKEELDRTPPVCSSRLEDAEALLGRLGVRLYREDFTRPGSRAPDPCAFMQVAAGFIGRAGMALGQDDPLDAVAAAWQLLGIDWSPIGAGPYRLVSESAAGIHLEAWPEYHGRPAATRFLDFVPTAADGSGVIDGSVDIVQRATLNAAARTDLVAHDARIVSGPQLGFLALYFNVRPGRIFADHSLREALQLCVDLVRDVDAAAGGAATPIAGPVAPGTWAHEPGLLIPSPDREAAKALIEASGWRLGADGIYVRDGTRLAAEILIRRDVQERVTMGDLIAKDARACGMELRPRLAELPDLIAMIEQYPHAIPGTAQPFDTYVGGFTTSVDPGSQTLFSSAAVSSEDRPEGENFIGFADPVADRLLADAMATYSQPERARLYRAFQRELAGRLPVLFLWSADRQDVVGNAIATLDGPLDVDAPFWAWRPERMVVASP